MKYTIDRFERKFAILESENRSLKIIKKNQLPEGAKEGFCVFITSSGIVIDMEETNKQRLENETLFDSLIEKEP